MTAPALVPPLGSHQLLLLLLQVSLLLATALLLGRLALRLGLPAVVGELCAGVVLGPSLLGAAAPGVSARLLPADPGQVHLLEAVGQLGMLLLVGVAGMHLDVRLAGRQRRLIAAVSAGGLALPFGLGLATGLLLPGSLLGPDGDRVVFALFVGVALSVSAIPVIAKTLLELRLLHRRFGQLVISAAVVDDVAGWMMLSVVSAAATSGPAGGRVAASVVAVCLTVGLALVAGRPLVRWLLRAAGRSPDPGVGIAVVVLVVLGCAAGTQALGLEAVFGAFVGGVLLASSGELDRERTAPLRTLVLAVLAPLFFASAGLRTDLGALLRPDVLAAGVVVLAVAVVGKLAGAYAGARAGRLGHWEAVATGAGLNARGVIEIVIATVGLRLGVLGTEMYTIVVLVAIATSVLAPPILRGAARRIPAAAGEPPREPGEDYPGR